MDSEKYVDPKSVKLTDVIQKDKVVRFAYFRDNEFWYRHQDGLLFPISLAEATSDRATFLAEDKAIYFMRWIKKYLDTFKE